MSSSKIKTPAHQWNVDWYRVKYSLVATLSNDGYVRRSEKESFVPASEEIESLLRACWQVLDPLPWKKLRRRNRETIEFIDKTVAPAALSQKALIDLALRNFEPGEDEGIDFASVRRRVRRGKPPTPSTIIEAIMASRKKRSASLSFDLACFFQLSGDSARAAKLVKEGFAAVPANQQERMRERVAADPMLRTIPGVAPPPAKTRKGLRCGRKGKGEGEGDAPKRKNRPWV
jgi:hypothetical protein